MAEEEQLGVEDTRLKEGNVSLNSVGLKSRRI